MSEYICNSDDKCGMCELYKTAEEIVRCKDCKHYHKHKWFVIPGTPLGSDMSDVCMFFGGGVKVEPGGFCKWGERRER